MSNATPSNQDHPENIRQREEAIDALAAELAGGRPGRLDEVADVLLDQARRRRLAEAARWETAEREADEYSAEETADWLAEYVAVNGFNDAEVVRVRRLAALVRDPLPLVETDALLAELRRRIERPRYTTRADGDSFGPNLVPGRPDAPEGA